MTVTAVSSLVKSKSSSSTLWVLPQPSVSPKVPVPHRKALEARRDRGKGGRSILGRTRKANQEEPARKLEEEDGGRILEAGNKHRRIGRETWKGP